MELNKYIYIIILALIFIVPLSLSFGKKIGFYKKWRYMIPSLIITAIAFIMWEQRFVEISIWQYNPKYIVGVFIKGVPLEQCLFFIAIPFLAFFLYETIKFFLADFEKNNIGVVTNLVLVVLFAFMAYHYNLRTYTFVTFLFLSVYLGYTTFRNQYKKHYTHFYLTFLIIILPYIIIAKTLASLPLIVYNNTQVSGIGFISLPIENFGFLFLLILMNMTIYEYLKEKKYF